MAQARLENWCVTPLQRSPYTPPECQAHGLHGAVYGHPSFDDGDEVTTTEIRAIRKDGERVVAVTRSGTEYLLGEIDPGYEQAFPNALQRIVDSYAGQTTVLG